MPLFISFPGDSQACSNLRHSAAGNLKQGPRRRKKQQGSHRQKPWAERRTGTRLSLRQNRINIQRVVHFAVERGES